MTRLLPILLLPCLLLTCATFETEPFFDDFSDPLLRNWIVLRGNWSVFEGKLFQSDPAVVPAFIVPTSDVWDDYSLELKAMRPEDALDGFLVVLRYPGGTDCIEWTIGGWSNTLSVLQRRTNFPGTQSWRYEPTVDSCIIETGRWYRMRAELRGTNIKCWLDGKLMVDYTDPEFEGLSPSRIALGTWRTSAYFDDVRVTPLD